MKRLKISLLYLLIIAFTSVQTGCFGTFSLTKKLWEFNKGVGDKIVQEAVFLLLVIIPVYEVCSFVDAIFLNLIEFWTGSNPISMKSGEIETQTMAFRGVTYKITAMQNKFVFEKKTGNKFEMVGTLEYKNKAWISNSDNKEHKLIGYNEKGQIEVFTKENKVYTMEKGLASSTLLKKIINEDSFAKR